MGKNEGYYQQIIKLRDEGKDIDEILNLFKKNGIKNARGGELNKGWIYQIITDQRKKSRRK